MQNNQLTADDIQVDIRKIANTLWIGKKLIIWSTSLFALSSLIIALMLPNQYRSVAVLAPASDSSGGLPRAFSQVSGLASLAGVKLGNVALTEAQIAVEIMKSWSFVDNFIRDNELEVKIYAVKGWDIDKNTLIIDDDIYDEVNEKWLIETDQGTTRAPTSWEIFEEFTKKITIYSDMDSGLVSLSVVHYSPYLAKEWVDLYVAAINKHMQHRKMTTINNSVEYLQREIEKSSIAGMHQVLYTIIEEQIKSKMISEASPEHTFVLVSPSMIPEVPSEPQRLLLFTIATFLGFILSVTVVLIGDILGGSKNKSVV